MDVKASILDFYSILTDNIIIDMGLAFSITYTDQFKKIKIKEKKNKKKNDIIFNYDYKVKHEWKWFLG